MELVTELSKFEKRIVTAMFILRLLTNDKRNNVLTFAQNSNI